MAKPRGMGLRSRHTLAGGALRRACAVPELPPRRPDAHKGDFGRVLILGGSRGMIGAPALAANAALRSGAGLATVACPEAVQLAVAALCPCATSIPLLETKAGLLDPRAAVARLHLLGLLGGPAAPSVVAAGPGLGRGHAAFDRGWNDLLSHISATQIPIVLDADGLNALPPCAVWADRESKVIPHSRIVITPHPGEMARLHGATTAAVQRDRIGFAVETARRLSRSGRKTRSRPLVQPSSESHGPKTVRPAVDHQPIVVLKGADTIVTDSVRIYVNKTGNPGMATGGSGDVLTGVIAALIAQGMTCFDAAVLGVHIHGLAGDLAARALGEVSLTAADLLDYLPAAFRARRPSLGNSAPRQNPPTRVEGRARVL